MAKEEKSLDNEVNLVPFISLLSVLICSLLLSAVWIQIGAMEVKQSVGGSAKEDNEKTPMVFARFVRNGGVEMRLKDVGRVSRKLRVVTIPGQEGEMDVPAVEAHIQLLREKIPELKTALIQPKSDSLYEHIIRLMDRFRAEGVADLGISPL